MQRIEFGADGIRGIADAWPLNRAGAVHIGQCLGRFAARRGTHSPPTVVIGRDTRPSGQMLLEGLQQGLCSYVGCLLTLGIATTPAVAYMTRRQDADLGVVVSASHNPAAYNGIKIVTGEGLRLQREEEMEIEALLNDAPLTEAELPPASGQISNGDHLGEIYVEDHVAKCPLPHLNNLRLVLDCANGAAAFAAPAVFRRLGAEVQVLHATEGSECINDGCGSESVRRQPETLANVVRASGAEYGFAFDGDGDRLVVVDSAGRFYDGDDILYALAVDAEDRGVLRHNTVVTTEMANSGLIAALHGRGIEVVFTGNGDKVLEAAIWRDDYLLGGEQSGNILINDGSHSAADAVFTAVLLAGLLRSRLTTLAQWVEPLVKHPQVVARLRLSQARLWRDLPDTANQIRIRQGSLAAEGGRLRAWFSSTEPGVFKIMVEGAPGAPAQAVVDHALAVCQVLQVESGESPSEAEIVQLPPGLTEAAPRKVDRDA